ncbi:uncharacterized protein LOC100127296 isoform X1 [Xenopus laevis]|uniref:Nucleotidyl transferase domain-containing protein n=2 Tax=Xenopus laevis TaxID=8355 RepID=A0A974H3X1_XENLA|nr:uncharacterized protein LOC100127296 [Xenopus laevis]XP_018089406.1 uncharacterized protein LOC100127296 isoform X1 [Xenopus laevis]AAI55904.1 LOC100127296 protein [Xenopus laevis]OCT63919.1 hypothetical protein XELAEV_18045014mg [Xenopus laevis]OCT63920.1 hypothetical protein XELAEV_18045014mg [Xenopus laevis]
MKVVILAAGYGTRLLRDLQNEEQFAHLVGTPKPLLPIGGLPLISYWVEALKARNDVSHLVVITNDRYLNNFKDWAQKYPYITVLTDGTSCNEDRLGAVTCLQLAIEQLNADDHVMVIGGDTLFFEDFHLNEVVQKFEIITNAESNANLVLTYPCKDEETNKYGILETDENQKVTALREKPSPKETASRQACPCFYVFSKSTLPLVQEFLEEKKNSPIDEKDAPGHFLAWLVKRRPVYIHPISGRFDVGNLEAYITCNNYFLNKENMCGYLH